jgi:exopolysaccharide production protein ExoZ
MAATRIDAIQGLRGIAALLVVVDHSILQLTAGYHRTPAGAELVRQAEKIGLFGVEIFFLISGFIMTVTTYRQFSVPGATTEFLWRRFVRIVPLYWLVTALLVVTLLVQRMPPEGRQVLLSLFFIPYQDAAGLYQPLVRRGWTLNYEMFFYALFALALLWRFRSGISALLLVLVLSVVAGQVGFTEPCDGYLCGIAWFFTRPILLFFAGGIVLALLRILLETRNRLLAMDLRAALGIALLITGIYAWCLISVSGPLTDGIGILGCVAATACCALTRDSPTHSRDRTVALAVGDASYSIYLANSFLIDPISKLWRFALGMHGLALFVLLMLAGTALLGVVTFRLVEKPMIQVLRRLRRRSLPRPGERGLGTSTG